MSERNTQDPSMEEILASIRRIISEDGNRVRGSEPLPTGMLEVEKQQTLEEALELTDVVLEDGTVSRLENASPESSTLRPAQSQLQDFEKVAEPSKAPDELVSPMTNSTSREDGELLSEITAAASATMFSQLANLVERQELPPKTTPLNADVRTLEDLVTELFRPYLREWLDKNLPAIIERLVRQEIEKLVRRAKDR